MTFARAKPSPLWWDAVPTEPTRPPLPGDADADVCIVGAGFTGLWTAYYLKRLDPSLRVIVLEREYVGFGASGRNGGWCHGEYPLGLATLAHRHGAEMAIRYQRAAFDAVLDRLNVGGPEEAGGTSRAEAGAPPSEPFRIRDYGVAAARLEAAAQRLTELLRTFDQTLGAAEVFLALHPELAEMDGRFDVMLVTPGQPLRHIEDAWRPGF